MRDIETALNQALPGLQTPSLGLLQAVLVSYAVEADGLWSLRPEDTPSLRRAEMEAVAQSLVTLGPRLNYTVQRQETPYRLSLWQENGETQFAFYLLASSVTSRLLRQVEIPPSKSNLIVLPGGRAGLLAYKFDRDPTLAGLARRWRIVNFATSGGSPVCPLSPGILRKEPHRRSHRTPGANETLLAVIRNIYSAIIFCSSLTYAINQHDRASDRKQPRSAISPDIAPLPLNVWPTGRYAKTLTPLLASECNIFAEFSAPLFSGGSVQIFFLIVLYFVSLVFRSFS